MMREEIRQTLDLSGGPERGDLWGEAMSAWFDIADVLTHNGHEDDIPASWQYHHSPVCNGSEQERFAAWVLGRVMPSELVHAGNVLMRYAGMLERKGFSY